MPTPSKAIHTRILAGGYLISSQTNKAVIKLDGDKVDVTAFEDTSKNFIVNDPKASIDISGYICHTAADADTYDAIANGALATPITVGVIKSSSATMTGGIGYVVPTSNAISLSHDMQVGNMMSMSASWGGASAMRRGKCVFAGSVAATGASAAVDVGAQGTVGGDAYLWVTTIVGSASSATIKVQSSATEGGSYADEGTFTFSAIGAYHIDLTGTVDRWLRINTTSKGGATSFVVHVIVCVDGVTQGIPA